VSSPVPCISRSAEVIDNNAANYTAWQFRRKCISELHRGGTDGGRVAAWREELAYCTEQCLENTKNYQVWFHRRACIDRIGDPTGELDFIEEVLDTDSKNYHAWGHRQWVLKRFQLWDNELAYIDRLLCNDVRNNSAWNQRYFVLAATADLTSTDLIANEITYTLAAIARAPNNSSPWAYLKGIVASSGFSNFPQVQQACERLGQGEGVMDGLPCVPALSLLVDILQQGGIAIDTNRSAELCMQLATLDPIRKNYWTYRRAQANGRAS
jgi:protein farnesyltransferase/geranylgeranyltransferase type-1 subunit alpha